MASSLRSFMWSRLFKHPPDDVSVSTLQESTTEVEEATIFQHEEDEDEDDDDDNDFRPDDMRTYKYVSSGHYWMYDFFQHEGPSDPYSPFESLFTEHGLPSTSEGDHIVIDIDGNDDQKNYHPRSPSVSIIAHWTYSRIFLKLVDKARRIRDNNCDFDVAKMMTGFSFAVIIELAIMHFQHEHPPDHFELLRLNWLTLGFVISFFISLTAVILRRSHPSIAKMVEKLGTISMVMTFFAMVACILPKNLMWFGSTFCILALSSIVLAISKSR